MTENNTNDTHPVLNEINEKLSRIIELLEGVHNEDDVYADDESLEGDEDLEVDQSP